MARQVDEPKQIVKALIDGAWISGERVDEIRDPFRGTVVAEAPRSTTADCDRALAAAARAKEEMAAMPPRERAALLRRAADVLARRTEEIAVIMTRETGKALKDSRIETSRAADTLRLCAEEAVRIEGSHVPMDASAIGSGKIGMVLRFPVGVVSAITPFNGPVNMVAHKLGPAIAAGNAAVLKPSPKAPLCAHKAVECFVEAGMPNGAINTLYGDDVGSMMVSDDRVDFVTFTGSVRVGKLIRAAAGLKRMTLELGSVGPTIVHSDANLDAAANACGRNAMLLAGQSCVSVQNVYVHASVLDRFMSKLQAEVEKLVVGDPLNEATDVGTLIDEAAARRVEGMVAAAVAEGAQVVTGGGRREGALVRPTVLFRVDERMSVVREEIFGPAMSIIPYADVGEVMAAISRSSHLGGLQVGLFTESLQLALRGIRSIRTGGVIVNGTSRWRSDQMPYGGVKDSGIGREGPKYAIRDMTEERFFVFNG